MTYNQFVAGSIPAIQNGWGQKVICSHPTFITRKIIDITHIKKLIRQIESRKTKIGKIRDELRELLDDFEDSVRDIEQGTYGLENGIESIKEALEAFSKTM